METRKIAWACFLGGCVFGLTTLAVAPRLWWLGCLSGFTAGYLTYEFREFLAAIPLAWRFAVRQGQSVGQAVFASVAEHYRIVRHWFFEEHPLIYLSLLLSLPCLNTLFASLVRLTSVNRELHPSIEIVVTVLLGLMVEFGLTLAGLLPLYALAWWGAKSNKQYFRLPTNEAEPDKSELECWQKLEAAGFRELPFTYSNVIRWIFLGIFAVLFTVSLKVPAKILSFIWLMVSQTILFMGRFTKYLFLLIHSEKRLLCGIDGTLGGLTAYWFGASQMTTLPEASVVIIAGGLLGALLGVANWELISKRWLGLAIAPP